MKLPRMTKILITGANGFIGRNLWAQLRVRDNIEVLRYTRESTSEDFRAAVSTADFVCHMAGVNRPVDETEFAHGNTDLTKMLSGEASASGRSVPILFASSVHAESNSAYGASKLAAETILLDYSEKTGAAVYIFRLPHVFGKWCRPNYNSVVATFCHNIARDLPVQIDDPHHRINIVYIDDLVATFAAVMDGGQKCGPYCQVEPTYLITVGELAERLRAFRASRETLLSARVGSGLDRALYSTYVSYIPCADFVYDVPAHRDPRGAFVEVLKTVDSGQFSYFTAPPGVSRGGHYHHTKTEKFLVVQGTARFRFRHIVTDDALEVVTRGEQPQIVEMIPGWIHDITNVGENEMIVMLWANEVFDRDRPDTYPGHF